MRVLIACEESQIVTEQFILRGHDAMSCDIEYPGAKGLPHYLGDVMDIINDGWGMMIGFPPCTYISYAGTRHWNNPGRVFLRLKALEFFAKLWDAPIDKICLENPKGCASPTIAKYSQEIQPYYFGDREMKTTWLWLKNLNPLLHSEEDNLFDNKTHTEKPAAYTFLKTSGKPTYFTDGKTRDPKIRSRTFQGIAEAMANQWG